MPGKSRAVFLPVVLYGVVGKEGPRDSWSHSNTAGIEAGCSGLILPATDPQFV